MSFAFTTLVIAIFATITMSVPTPTSGAALPRVVTAWLNRYDWADAVDSLARNAAVIREAGPQWYQVTPEGKLEEVPGSHANDHQFFSIARSNDISVLPLVT